MNWFRFVVIFLSCVALSVGSVSRAEDCVRFAKAELELDTDAIVGGPMNIAAVEEKSLAEIAACSHCPQKPFGYLNAKWEEFKSEMRPGDCVVFFRSGRTSWNQLMGVEGYALMRGEKLVRKMITGVS